MASSDDDMTEHRGRQATIIHLPSSSFAQPSGIELEGLHPPELHSRTRDGDLRAILAGSGGRGYQRVNARGRARVYTNDKAE